MNNEIINKFVQYSQEYCSLIKSMENQSRDVFVTQCLALLLNIYLYGSQLSILDNSEIPPNLIAKGQLDQTEIIDEILYKRILKEKG